MKKIIISTDKAPSAIGAYSQAVKAGRFVYTSGQIAINPSDGTLNTGDITEQTHQVLKNITAVLEAAGSCLDNVVKTTVFVTDMGNFAAINEVYSQYFTKDQPARSFVEAARLPKDVGVEIETIAIISEDCCCKK